MQTLLVTGGAGFIGACYVLTRCAAGDTVINLDKLTYSENPLTFYFPFGRIHDTSSVEGDIGNAANLLPIFFRRTGRTPQLNFAAESHVDRSILDPDAFVRTNVFGTCSLLRTVKDGWTLLTPFEKAAFRFLLMCRPMKYSAL